MNVLCNCSCNSSVRLYYQFTSSLLGVNARYFSSQASPPSAKKRDGMWAKLAIWDNFGTKVNQNQSPPTQREDPTPSSTSNNVAAKSNSRVFDEDFIRRAPQPSPSNTTLTYVSPLKIEGKRSFMAVEIDNKGTVTQRTIPKNELLGGLKIQARDLRSIDVAYPHQMASILVREKALIVQMTTIRTVIQWDKLLIFGGHEDEKVTEAVVFFLRDFISNAPDKEQAQALPFEFRALEAILIHTCDVLDKQVSSLQPLIDAEIRSLQTNPEHQLQNLELYHHKKQLTRCEVTTQEMREALEDILQNDEDMAEMYLSTKAFTGYPRRKNQHEEIEILLENYLRQIEQIQGLIKELRESIVVTEDYVNLQLDSVRNRMMRYNLVLTVGTLSTSLGGLITGAFGMNLHTGLESNPYAFFFVSGLVASCATAMFLLLRQLFGVRYLASHYHTFRTSRRAMYHAAHQVADKCGEYNNPTDAATSQPLPKLAQKFPK